VVCASKVYSATGADIVYGIITLIVKLSRVNRFVYHRLIFSLLVSSDSKLLKRHKAWWVLLALQAIAWGPFLIEEVVHRLRGMTYYPDEEVAVMYGFWLFIWWPLTLVSVGILLYLLLSFVLSRLVRN